MITPDSLPIIHGYLYISECNLYSYEHDPIDNLQTIDEKITKTRSSPNDGT